MTEKEKLVEYLTEEIEIAKKLKRKHEQREKRYDYYWWRGRLLALEDVLDKVDRGMNENNERGNKEAMLKTAERHIDYNMRCHADDLARQGFDLFKRRRPELKIEKFVKKPIPVEMVQITNDNVVEVAVWCGGKSLTVGKPGAFPDQDWIYCGIEIKTREGKVRAKAGDFIAKGIEGEFYPIGKDIHEKTYDKVEE